MRHILHCKYSANLHVRKYKVNYVLERRNYILCLLCGQCLCPSKPREIIWHCLFFLPEEEIGEIGPTKSMPMWYIGDFTGIGWSSGRSKLSLYSSVGRQDKTTPVKLSVMLSVMLKSDPRLVEYCRSLLFLMESMIQFNVSVLRIPITFTCI